MTEQMKGTWEKVKSFFAAMSKTTKMLLAAIVVIALLFFIGIWIAKKTQPYDVLFYDLSSADISSVSTWLSENGYGSDIKIEGSNVLVPAPLVDATKAGLYIAGIPSSGSGYESYYGNLGAMSTDSDKARAYLFLLQDRMGSVIRQYSGVKEATVTINLGEDRTYVLDSSNLTPATATVDLKMEGSTGISAEVANAIRKSVSHAVPDLSVEYVNISDNLGNNYAETGSGVDAVSDASYMKMKLESDYNNDIRAQLLSFLAEMYGVGNVSVTVRTTVDVNRKFVQSTDYPEPEGLDNYSERGAGIIGAEVWNNYASASDMTGIGGIVGATPNSDMPFYPADTDGDGILDNQVGSYGEITYKNPETVQQIQYLAGTVTDMQITATINSDAVPENTVAVNDLVTHIGMAAGIDMNLHANKVSVLFHSFVEKDEEVVTGLAIPEWMLFAIIAGLALFIIILVVIVILVRKKKREKEEQEALEEEMRIQEEERVRLEEEALAAAAAAEAAEPADGADIMDMNTEKSMELRKDLRTFVGNNPEIAASLLRNLMKGGATEDAT